MKEFMVSATSFWMADIKAFVLVELQSNSGLWINDDRLFVFSSVCQSVRLSVCLPHLVNNLINFRFYLWNTSLQTSVLSDNYSLLFIE